MRKKWHEAFNSLDSVWLCFLSLQASLVVWVIILRFMGDLPEPAMFARNVTKNSSMMTQIYDTLGRKNQVQFKSDSPGMVRWAMRLCLYFHMLSLISLMFYQDWEKQTNLCMVLKYQKCKRAPVSPRTQQLLLAREDKTKTSLFDHLSFPND